MFKAITSHEVFMLATDVWHPHYRCMRDFETMDVGQLGATGLVAERFRRTAYESGLNLAFVATARNSQVGRRLRDVSVESSPWDDLRLISLDDALHNTDAPVLFSNLRTETAAKHELTLARGRWLSTNAAANRMRQDVALFNPYINPDQLGELRELAPEYMVMAVGNCMSVIADVALAPIERHIGIKALDITTLQGWSGDGQRFVPDSVTEPEPIEGDEQEKLETETNRFLGSLSVPAAISIMAEPLRAPWLHNHRARIVAYLAGPTTKKEIEELWRTYQAPEELHGINYGPNSPQDNPITVVRAPMLGYDSATGKDILALLVPPMGVLARVLAVSGSLQDVLEFEVVGNNLKLGAVGSGIMNIMFARVKGYL